MEFSLSLNYPAEKPSVNVSCDLFKKADMEELALFINDEIEGLLNQPMIYNLTCSIKDWLEERRALIEQRKSAQSSQSDLIEEANTLTHNIRPKFPTATPVNLANFLSWKLSFDEEWQKNNRKVVDKRLTGKQLFEQDRNLALSDVKFMDEGDVPIDSSLFDNIHIGDDEDDNEPLE